MFYLPPSLCESVSVGLESLPSLPPSSSDSVASSPEAGGDPWRCPPSPPPGSFLYVVRIGPRPVRWRDSHWLYPAVPLGTPPSVRCAGEVYDLRDLLARLCLSGGVCGLRVTHVEFVSFDAVLSGAAASGPRTSWYNRYLEQMEYEHSTFTHGVCRVCPPNMSLAVEGPDFGHELLTGPADSARTLYTYCAVCRPPAEFDFDRWLSADVDALVDLGGDCALGNAGDLIRCPSGANRYVWYSSNHPEHPFG